MRTLIVLIVLILTATGAAWLGGETWLARQVARGIADNPGIAAGSVTPLRRIDRIGLKLSDLSVDTAEGPATLPSLDLWAAPTSPTEFNASLPAEFTLPFAGAPRKLGAQAAGMALRISPTSGMAVSRASVNSGPITVDGAPLAERVAVTAQLKAMGAFAPPAAKASYVVTADLAGLTSDKLAGLAGVLPLALADAGPIAVNGRAQIFLTGSIVPGAAAEPQLAGLSSDGLTLSIGALSARITGQIAADDQGRAQGALFVYSRDPRGWLALAGEAGLVPAGFVPLAGTALETAAVTEAQLPPGIAPPAPAEDGEFRIPLIFRDGRSFLGPMPIGDAPEFPR